MPLIRAIAVFALLMSGGAACNLGNLFKSSGAACITDANCPSPLACCDGKCQADCSSGGTLVASVTLVTDWVPGYQFDEVQVTLDGQQRSLPVTVTFEFLNPLRVGEYGEVSGGRQHEVFVKLAPKGALVVQRAVTFSATTDVTVPVVITRDCDGKACGELETCVAGACVNTICSQLQTQFCPAPECSADADCAGSVPCAVGYCYEGMCLEKRRDTLCLEDQRCIPGIGCVVKVPECAADTDCSDGFDCTRETCSNGSCDSIRDDSLCAKTICDPSAQGSDPKTGCTAAPCSADTCKPGPCETATCVDNKCTRTTLCQGTETCCGSGVCATNCNDPRACASRAAGYVCRASVGTCDPPETCDGHNDSCPADQVYSAGTQCRVAGGACDVAEACDGTSANCPGDTLTADGTVCRAANGVCDVAETCNGRSAACPAQGYVSSGTECRGSAGVCDVHETCPGTGPNCPGDSFQGSNVVCRGAVGNGCDIAEYCTGSSAGCPPDSFATGVCRNSAGACDPPESCPGDGPNCPGDWKSPAGTVCNPQNGECDITDTCDGSNAGCPTDNVQPSGVVCRASGGVCDPAETCNGGKTCPGDARLGSGTVCLNDTACAYAATCNGGVGCPGYTSFKTGVCRGGDASNCDQAESCTGSSPDCPGDAYAPAGTVCRGSSGSCDYAETCTGGLGCPGDAKWPDGSVCSNTQANCGATCSGGVCQGGISCGTGTRICCDQSGDVGYCSTVNACNCNLRSTRQVGELAQPVCP